MHPSIGINMDVPAGYDIRCYFPGYRNPTSASSNQINIDVFIETNNFHHRYMPRPYWAKYSQYNGINIPLTSTGLSSSLSISEYSFWNTASTK